MSVLSCDDNHSSFPEHNVDFWEIITDLVLNMNLKLMRFERAGDLRKCFWERSSKGLLLLAQLSSLY